MSPLPATEPDAHDRNTAIALFRYGLIAQLVHTPPDSGQQEDLLRDIAARTYTIPGSTRTRVSVTTLRRYFKTYVAQGFDALRPTARADTHTSRAFPAEVLHQAIALREEQPARTTQTIVDILQRDPQLTLDPPINVHTLTTHLRQRGQTRRLLNQSAKAYRRLPMSPLPRSGVGRCASASTSTRCGKAMRWPAPGCRIPKCPVANVAPICFVSREHCTACVDDHSRLVPFAEFFFDETLPRMERVLKGALLRRGVPQAVYVDNGQVYSSLQFGAACATLGIERIKAAPFSPEGKGKQERFFESLRAQFLPEVETSQLTTLAELNASWWAWLECIYTCGAVLPSPARAQRDATNPVGALHRRS